MSNHFIYFIIFTFLPKIYVILNKEVKESSKMDVVLILLVVAIIIVGLFFRDFKSVVYFLGIIDIAFRLFHKLIALIQLEPVTEFVVKYIPSSLEAVINHYSTGILNTILVWILFLLYVYFLVYLVKYWVKKKK